MAACDVAVILALMISAFVDTGKAADCANTDPACKGIRNPCLNGGQCCIQGGKPVCDCEGTGYGGNFCQSRFCHPKTDPCKNGGTCALSGTQYVCKCPKHTAGTKCQLKPCNPNPCFNGGTCNSKWTGTGYYTCSCVKFKNGAVRFGGYRCQKDYCSPSPCKNGGTCVRYARPRGHWWFKCVCPTGFLGAYCHVANKCGSKPCKNGAVCYPGYSSWGYACYHKNFTDWWGRNNTERSPCYTGKHGCKNGGTCYRHWWYDYPNKYRCKCPTKWLGCPRCDKPNVCLNPGRINVTGPVCNNRGTCRPYCSSFRCYCKSPYCGSRCQYRSICIDPGSWNLTGPACFNRGRCYSYCSKFRCGCRTGFGGHRCQYDYSKHGKCWGDPRCATFDGIPFNYHGTCDAILTKSCVNNWPVAMAPTFQIIGQFRKCRNPNDLAAAGVSCATGVSVQVDGKAFTMERRSGRSFVLKIDGNDTKLPAYHEDPEKRDPQPLVYVQVCPFDPFGQVEIVTNWGLHVSLSNFPTKISVGADQVLAKAMFGRVCGMYGNANNNPRDDAILGRNVLMTPLQPKGCTTSIRGGAGRKKRAAVNPKYPDCETKEALQTALNACSIINNATGPLRMCRKAHGYAAKMFVDCVSDVCTNETFRCSYLEGYASFCGRFTCYENWRAVTKCPIRCPAGMKYKIGFSRLCVPTCFKREPCVSNRTLIQNTTCDEGCVCADDKIWDPVSAKCINPDKCGKTKWSFPKAFGDNCEVVERPDEPGVVTCRDKHRKPKKHGCGWRNRPYCKSLGVKYGPGEINYRGLCHKRCDCVKRGPGRGYHWRCHNMNQNTTEMDKCLEEHPNIAKILMTKMANACSLKHHWATILGNRRRLFGHTRSAYHTIIVKRNAKSDNVNEVKTKSVGVKQK